MSDVVFALDIGTRSVTGLLLEKQQDKFAVIDYYIKEHTERSMRDGQIHNVLAVSEVIKHVKDKLEKQSETVLKRACVAAAGRSLKTVVAAAAIPLHQQPITNNEKIKHLELSAVQAAQINLASRENNNDYTNYYCVGYSVLQYTLDNDQIGSLIDQSGDEASVEIIATFLPKVVVESLLAALTRADLEMEALTLEPIAAIHVLIPESMRRLNVALVDVGAGTSDIAITDKGTVAAYGMVPVAGDEITEAISDLYLLDFPQAEETKRRIVNDGEETVADILGFESVITYDTLVQDISDHVNKLAAAIADEIMQLNAKPPRAVMLVGGGSLTPNLTKSLAHKLDLPENRVAVRGSDAIQNLIKNELIPQGPDFVTPIGIAIAAKQNPVHYVSVRVNEQMVRLFEMKQLTVGDCLIQAGTDLNKLYGKPGMAVIVKVNDQDITLPGSFGEAPVIYVNNKKAHLENLVHSGDEIQVIRGKDGAASSVTLEELIGEAPAMTVFYNNKPYQLHASFYVNGQLKTKDYVIKDNDIIVWKQSHTIKEFLFTTVTENITSAKPFTVLVNNRKLSIDKGETHIYLNGEKVSADNNLKHNDKLNVTSASAPAVSDLLHQLDKKSTSIMKVTFNGQPVELKQKLLVLTRGNEELELDSILKLNDELVMKEVKAIPFIFQDIFRYVEIDLSRVSGNFKLYKNNEETSFDEEINTGDVLEIRWDRENNT
ncbi:cell division protein FtsA [Oceanobacillus saliphilus]|uniref:cell division protein FtsA n=1 Tax=Oceanobacillus saliphilus TaxID=2925834 RepID=UPI00201E7484|nr:pilus assembly protein PilM [Oceanobacillus saliphilus]